jgi:hypothetical protein
MTVQELIETHLNKCKQNSQVSWLLEGPEDEVELEFCFATDTALGTTICLKVKKIGS